MIIRGRVVDADGRPVAGAEVILDDDFTSMPAVGQAAARHRDALTELTGPAGDYVFSVASHPGLAQLRTPALLALHGRRVSQKIVLDWRDQPITAGDLVVRGGVVGRVRVVWDDGSPGSSVSLHVMLSEHTPDGDDARAGLHSFEGVTNEHGEMSFGPVADHEYKRIIVRMSHPDAPTRSPWWDGQRVSATDPIELSLFRGRIVRGRLLTPDGQPAAGYRVAPWGGEIGDPDPSRATTADSTGHFEVRGVGSQSGAIAVYKGLPRPDAGDTVARLQAAMARSFLGHPLLIQDVPLGQDDLGTVSIPALGTLEVRVEDVHGAPVRSATAFWMRSGVPHGGRGCRADPQGILRLKHVPLGIAIVLRLTFDDPLHGEMEQAFKIPEVREETITLRATGAGTVVFRLHPKGAPGLPLTVDYATFGEHEYHGAALDGPLSEYHWWTCPGFYPSLRVTAKGFRERLIENVDVRDDGPTFLDVELEPR